MKSVYYIPMSREKIGGTLFLIGAIGANVNGTLFEMEQSGKGFFKTLLDSKTGKYPIAHHVDFSKSPAEWSYPEWFSIWAAVGALGLVFLIPAILAAVRHSDGDHHHHHH